MLSILTLFAFWSTVSNLFVTVNGDNEIQTRSGQHGARVLVKKAKRNHKQGKRNLSLNDGGKKGGPGMCSCDGFTGYLAFADCKGFIYCDASNPTVVKPIPCPPGLVFNVAANVCDWPSDAPNCPRTCELPNPPVWMPPDSEEEEEDWTRCSCASKRFIPASNCQQFIDCFNNGPKIAQDCAAGTKFNYHIQTCDFAEYVTYCPDPCEDNY